MNKKRPTNETIRIGDIFEHYGYDDEGGRFCSFCQVVGKRGKTLVELRQIQMECYVDEECYYGNEEGKRGINMVKVRPLPGQFSEGAEVFTLGVCEPSQDTGRNLLKVRGGGRGILYYFFQVPEDGESYLCGRGAISAIRALKKEGKLPPWANELVN